MGNSKKGKCHVLRERKKRSTEMIENESNGKIDIGMFKLDRPVGGQDQGI